VDANGSARASCVWLFVWAGKWLAECDGPGERDRGGPSGSSACSLRRVAPGDGSRVSRDQRTEACAPGSLVCPIVNSFRDGPHCVISIIRFEIRSLSGDLGRHVPEKSKYTDELPRAKGILPG
jgi:hypothetical protein